MIKLVRRLRAFYYAAWNKEIFRWKKVDSQTDITNINGVLRIVGKGEIRIGVGTRMNSGPRANPIGGDTALTLNCRQGGRIDIGPGCGLSNCAIVADEQITLEENVMIGGGVKIYDTDFHNIDPTLRAAERAGSFHGVTRPVRICRGAFVGAHSMVLKGVTIGRNAVIGAGSIVTRDVPDHEIWAGNPARRIGAVTVTDTSEVTAL